MTQEAQTVMQYAESHFILTMTDDYVFKRF